MSILTNWIAIIVIAFAILACAFSWLLTRQRALERWWSARFEQHLRDLQADALDRNALIDRLSESEKMIQQIRMGMGEFQRLQGHYGNEAIRLEHDIKLRVEAIEALVTTSFSEIEIRLDATETKLDIPRSRKILRGTFSQLRQKIAPEPFRLEPSRYDSEGKEINA